MSTSTISLLLPVPFERLLIADRSSESGSNQKPLKFSLVIPTFNEGENISEIVRIISKLLDRIIPGEYELIVVDDDSPDRTWELACKLMSSYPQLR